LQDRCHQEKLSLREAAQKANLSHVTIAGVIHGDRPSVGTIRKLAQGFGDGTNERLTLEDRFLVLAGYRTHRPQEKLNVPLAQLMDQVRQFSESKIKMMRRFADFLTEIDRSWH